MRWEPAYFLRARALLLEFKEVHRATRRESAHLFRGRALHWVCRRGAQGDGDEDDDDGDDGDEQLGSNHTPWWCAHNMCEIQRGEKRREGKIRVEKRREGG